MKLKHPNLGLGHAPHAPIRLIGYPAMFASRHIGRGELVPVRAITVNMFRKLVHSDNPS